MMDSLPMGANSFLLEQTPFQKRFCMQESKLGPVVQSIVSLTSLLVFKMLTVLESTISNSQVFLLKKNVSSFCKCKSYSHFFQQKY